MRFAVDTGGTFTDLVIEDDEGQLTMAKSSTTPDDPVRGVIDVVAKAARQRGMSLAELLGSCELFIHGTTRAINAILTGNTARTALLTTAGHPDVLLFREGGRTDPFNHGRPFPAPYVPRALTFEVTGRIGSEGEVVDDLDEAQIIDVARRLKDAGVEAVGVCLLWSILNGAHERRVGELLAEHLPGVPVTLSHELNPTIREYRRASSVAIDASLKPLMTTYLAGLEARLRAAGFGGRLLVVTSSGGVLDAAAVGRAPIHSINSGPSMAPVAGRHYALLDGDSETAMVADTGGTSYDVSLVRRGRIPLTRETWLGDPYFGHMTGFPSVDVKSIGAGGGSIARVDEGGLLHVGPQSAGADPGPVCYGRGGTRPTVTDACLVLGYLDPGFFLGGDLDISVDAAIEAVERDVAEPLGISVDEAAAAVVALATEHMVHAIEDITINQGIDPSQAVLVGGGGAAGFNAVAIATRLGAQRLVIPETGAALSAAGALLSELTASTSATVVTSTADFDAAAVNETLERLVSDAQAFIDGPGAGAVASEIELWVEARYPQQVWQLDVPLRVRRIEGASDLEQIKEDFHRLHKEVFAVNQPEAEVELVAWHARGRCRLRDDDPAPAAQSDAQPAIGTRRVYFGGHGHVDAEVIRFEHMATNEEHEGPALVESPFTTVVIDPGAAVRRTASGSLSIRLATADEPTLPNPAEEIQRERI